MNIGETIRELRKSRNLSQEQFAEMFHVTRQAVSNWEHDRNYPDMKVLKKISEEFGIPLDALIGDDEDYMEEVDSRGKKAARWKKTSIVLAVAVAVALILAGIPAAVSWFCYNPEKVAATSEDGIETKQLELDMSVFSTLAMPGMKLDQAQVNDRGMGCYSVSVSQTAYGPDMKQNMLTGEICRNRFDIYNRADYDMPSANMFEWYGSRDIRLSLKENLKKAAGKGDWREAVRGAGGTPDDSMSVLENLKSERIYRGYISFNRVKSVREAQKWIKKYDDIWQAWAAVALSEDHQDGPVGFYLTESGVDLSYDSSRYPKLIFWGGEDDIPLETDKGTDTHFISMLRYMSDNRTFFRMMEDNGMTYNLGSPEKLQKAAEFIEKEGVNIYGLCIEADRETLMRMLKEPDVFSIAAVSI